MGALLELIRKVFHFGKGRPVALIILSWTVAGNIVSELPPDQRSEAIAQRMGGAFTGARQALFDGYQRNAPRQPQFQPVTIVGIDEESLARYGQWPWPRTQLAALLDALGQHGPAAVGLDMYLPEPDQTSPDRVAERLPPDTPDAVTASLRALPSHEAILAQSLNAIPSVLGAAGFDHDTYTTSAGMRTHPVMVTGEDPLPHLRRFDAVLASLPELQAAAHGQAILSVDLDFGVVRRVPLVVAVGDTVVAGLAMEMLRVATGDPAVRVTADRRGVASVAIADLMVPTQPAADIWVHFASIDDTIGRYVSAADVLDGSVSPDAIAGKLVLLGLTGSGLHDMRTTALGELVPGIEIQAQLLENLFEGRIILRPWWLKWLEIGAVTLLALVLIWAVPRSDSPIARFLKAVPRASLWITLGLNLSLLALGYLLFSYRGLLYNASSSIIILSSVIGSLIASAMIEIYRVENERNAQRQRQRESALLLASGLATTVAGNNDGLEYHRDTVQQLAGKLAREAVRSGAVSPALAEQQIDDLSRAAGYCDIGLALVPSDTLDSSTPLSEDERRQVEEHTVIGALAVTTVKEALLARKEAPNPASLAFLECLEAVVLNHHEQWDGEGYPNGLAGTDIPITARIVAIVDSWVSLRSDRPWRAAMDEEQALATLRAGAGNRYDPALVPCLERVIAGQ